MDRWPECPQCNNTLDVSQKNPVTFVCDRCEYEVQWARYVEIGGSN